MNWLTDRRSQKKKERNSTNLDLRIQLWGTAFTSNMEISEHLQSKAMLVIMGTWYVPKRVIRIDLQTPGGKEEIRRYSSQYSARLTAHSNDLTVNIVELPDNRRLPRHLLNYL
jgi:hypothetical protein